MKIVLDSAIAGSVYQIFYQVASEVGSSVISNDANLMQTLQELPNPPILLDSHPGRVKLEVRRIIALQLENLGINPEQVSVSPHYTYS